MERHLVVASKDGPSKLENAAEVRGAIHMIDALLATDLDRNAEAILGIRLDTPPSTISEPHMPLEPHPDTEES